MDNQVFQETYGINQESEALSDVYGSPAYSPPSEEPEYFFSIYEFISIISKTLDTASVVINANPIIQTIYLQTPTIAINANAISISIAIHAPTVDIAIEAEALAIEFGPVLLATAHLDIEAEPIATLIGPTWVYLTVANIDVEAIEVSTSEADVLPTAEIIVSAFPVSTQLVTYLPETSITVESSAGSVIIGISLASAHVDIEAHPILIPVFLDTAYIEVEAIPGHTGEVTILATAAINVSFGQVYPCIEVDIADDSFLFINLYRSNPGEIPPPEEPPEDPEDPVVPPSFDEDMYVGVENPSIGRFELEVSGRAMITRGE